MIMWMIPILSYKLEMILFIHNTAGHLGAGVGGVPTPGKYGKV